MEKKAMKAPAFADYKQEGTFPKLFAGCCKPSTGTQ